MGELLLRVGERALELLAPLKLLGALPLYGLTARFRVEPPLAGIGLDLNTFGELREETSGTFLAARTSWVVEPREMEIRGETYYSVEKTAGDAWTLPQPWLADWVTEQCRRDLAAAGGSALSGHEGVWLAREPVEHEAFPAGSTRA